MYKAIIFDFFGVVAKKDFYEAWLNAYGYKRENKFLLVAQDGDTGKIDLKEYYARLSMLSNQSVKAIRKEINGYIQINQDVVHIINLLSKEYKLGLLSTAPAELLRSVLKKYDLEQYFNEIIISSDVGITKSNPHIFELMLKKIDAIPEETIFIDDLQKCVESAETVGIKGIQFLNTDKLINDLKRYNIKNI